MQGGATIRTLGDALTASQKIMGDAKCKIVLTGAATKTYDIDSETNRILDLSHKEQEWSQTCQVTVDNREGNLTALTLEGYKGVISYGYVSTYSAAAPLTVIGQKTDSLQGENVTTFSLAGLFNMWGEQEATVAYSPDEINTDTVKTIMDAIASHSMTCFGSYPVHTITYDTGYDDSIINSFTPKDNFTVAKGESRLSAFKKVLAYTKCKARIENDSGTATIHVYLPTISGETWVASTDYIVGDYVQPTTPNNNFTYRCTTAGTSDSSEPTWPTTAGNTVNDNTAVWTAVDFDYEYNDSASEHNFYNKSVRTRLVLPNKVWAGNHPDHEDSYSGTATDAASYAALGYYITKTVYVRASGNAQCTLIAKAILQKYQLAAEKGSGFVPMNCGQEVMDYVKITDSWASDLRIGSIGYIHRHYTPGKFTMEFRFGTLEILGLAGTVPPAITTVKHIYEGLENYQALVDMVESLIDDHNAMRESLLSVISTANAVIDYLLQQQWEGEFAKLSVTLRLQIPQGTNMYT